ncbi:ABC transporter permease [Pseudonocardia ailaonensis]|uniref:ABC transporter permease n=1 Tax=Pseudonocardia ailaonensis TaxID=367279 RepID=A0ABN2N7K2_9PSEU
MSALWSRNGWWVRRLAILPVHLLLFAVVVFFLVKLIPGDPVAVLSGGQRMTPEQYEAARASLGLTGTVFGQLGAFLVNTVTLDLGNSVLTGTSVLAEMGSRLPETVELAVMAMVVSSLVAVGLGFLVVLRPRNLVSRAVASYSRAAGAVPDFCLGVAGIFVFYSVLHWAPAPIGRYDTLLNPPPRTTGFPFLDALFSSDTALMGSMLAHLWLPVGVLVVAYAPMLVKLFIRSLDQAKNAQATKFRIASGASRRMVMVSIARRALPATVAMFGTIFGFMVGGAVVVEQLFAIPGMGEYAVQAVTRSDFVSLRGFLLIVGALSLLVFFLVDVVTMLLDPRRRPGVAVAGG